MTSRFLKTTEIADVGVVTLNRPGKRNALDESAIGQIDAYFSSIPAHIRAIVLRAEGDHFCAGLDLKEHHDQARSAVAFMRVCQAWHRAFDKIQHGGIPVVGCLQGAVVGGGLELASATHVRVAHRSAYFALPEGTRGIFTGGGATVRTARILSTPRMVEMMLTGRVIDVDEGLRLGLAHYVCDEDGDATFEMALGLARKIAGSATLSNYAIVGALSRISDMSASDDLFTEALMAAVVQTGDDVPSRLARFVDKTAAKVKPATVAPDAQARR